MMGPITADAVGIESACTTGAGGATTGLAAIAGAAESVIVDDAAAGAPCS
jgi:hypothetical protein